MTSQHYRALRRPRRERVFLGVCAALGNFLGISPFWFRLAFLIALIPGGAPGLVLYLLGWMIIPAE